MWIAVVWLSVSQCFNNNWKQLISNFFLSLRHTEIHIFVFSKICDRRCHSVDSVESLKIRQWYYVTNFIVKAVAVWILHTFIIMKQFLFYFNEFRNFSLKRLIVWVPSKYLIFKFHTRKFLLITWSNNQMNKLTIDYVWRLRSGI